MKPGIHPRSPGSPAGTWKDRLGISAGLTRNREWTQAHRDIQWESHWINQKIHQHWPGFDNEHRCTSKYSGNLARSIKWSHNQDVKQESVPRIDRGTETGGIWGRKINWLIASTRRCLSHFSFGYRSTDHGLLYTYSRYIVGNAQTYWRIWVRRI